MRELLVTSALPYANGPIHIGHLVEYIQTDIWVRYWRLRGRDTIYLCADDTHGTPIMLRARDEGVSPEDLIARSWQEHQRDFAGFHIQFDSYYTTHSEENRILASGIYEALRREGHISERTIEQAYCDTDRMFLPDRYIRGKCPSCGAEDQHGDACEVCSNTYSARDLINAYCAQCGSVPAWRESVHIFFRLADFADRLRDWVRGHAPEEIGNKLEEWFESGLQDWDISRDAPYFGFEIPGHAGKYFYVWLDAPVGYMASTMDYCRRTGRDFDSYWRSEDSDVVHFIGKDIVYFHALFWPAMLMGAGYRTPTRLIVHGFLTVNGEKMSKSRGTFINAETYLRHLDPQHLRYYYAAKLGSAVADLDLNFDDFTNRVNADLVNKIANIPSRVMAILHEHAGGRLSNVDGAGHRLIQQLKSECGGVAKAYEEREFGMVTRHIADMAVTINGYLQEQKPWAVAKEDPARAAVICTGALNAFRLVTTLLAPILPEFAKTVARMLGLERLTWAGLDEILEDRPVLAYQRLAERVDRSRVGAVIADSKESMAAAELVAPPVMTLDPLVDADLRVMRVEEAKGVPGSGKLINLTLRTGEERRQVLAGLGGGAARGGAKGENFLVLANLQPRAIKGLVSQGMILAAEMTHGPEPARFADMQVDALLD